ncbi:MAG: arylsulfatase [Sphingomonadaceae bacterium]
MAKKPNILFIMADDIGISNLSCYSDGLMGYRTPNIDRIAREGIRFTDSYGEQSCTAGRAAFATGQNPYRSGMTKVGAPGADFGIPDDQVTIADALKEQGYRTGQFGKNHFGDQDRMLPTNHGFDEFFGILYHLNAMEEPSYFDYPSEKDFPGFRKRFGPRNVLSSWADGKIVDEGELFSERMKTFDDEVNVKSKDFIKRAVDAGEPFFVWHNNSHMHYRTHTKDESIGQAGRWQSRYHDTMIDHDKNIGDLLDYLDELGVADDTIVVYTTDNGPHMNEWPDSAMTPFRNEKNSNWEGGFRVPMLARWGKNWLQDTVLNGIVSLNDWFRTLCTAAGNPDIKDQLHKGTTLHGVKFTSHLDGFDLSEYLTGKADESPRNYFFYVTDDGDLAALRFDHWKFVFLEQECNGTYNVWGNPFTKRRMPKLFNLRMDPFEKADITSNTYWKWFNDHQFLAIPAQAFVAEHIQSFREFPAKQTPPSFTIDQVVESLQRLGAGND